MTAFASHYRKMIVATSVEEVDTLPIFSIIDVDSTLYEKTVTPRGATSLFIELGHTGENVPAYTLTVGLIAEHISEGRVRILRVSN